MLKEDSYGVLKRYGFIADAVKNSRAKPVNILDIGCGTGEMLAIPLSEGFKADAHIFAFDPDKNSMERLKERCAESGLRNITIIDDDPFAAGRKYDLVIISEVLEHIHDPEAFLGRYAELVAEKGKMVITVPNGCGYFELDSMLERLLMISGIIPLLKKIKRAVIKKKPALQAQSTLSADPHINFFGFKEIWDVFTAAGLKVEKYEGRTFLCGFLVSPLINKFRRLLKINNILGSRLPPAFVSGWMFILAPGGYKNSHFIEGSKRSCSQSWYASFKRAINLRSVKGR